MNRDIIVIGGGPGGYVAAIRGAQLGLNVTLIEKHKIGGTCLNYGCIPTKTLFKNAEILNTLKHIEDFGIKVDNYSLDIEKIQSRKSEVVAQLTSGINQLLEANGVEIIMGSAELVDKNTVKISKEDGETETLSGKNIIIASGSKPFIPPIEGAKLEGVYTSKEILDFKEVPKKLVVIGGGVIGMEIAGIFNEMGSEVTVIEFAKNILPPVDKDISKRLVSYMKKRGMSIYTSYEVTKIERLQEGLKVTAKGKKDFSIDCDAVLISTGRMPITEGLNLEEVGIEYNRKGIQVDDNFMTNIEGIYAIGDANGKIMLAHAASHQGVAVIEHIAGIESHINFHTVPSCIFVLPEISVVGITEDMAKEQGIEYKVSKFLLGANCKAVAMGEPEGFVKVICDMDYKIIGVQIMGLHASDLIHEGALAVGTKMSVEDVGSVIHAHPTLSEAFMEAVLGLKGEAIHMVPSR